MGDRSRGSNSVRYECRTTHTPFHLPTLDNLCDTPPMKRILAPILLLTLLFPALTYEVTMHDLVVRDGIHYEKFSDVTSKVGNTGVMIYFSGDLLL